MADRGRPTLSVIVVTYNERELVEMSLPPLLEQLEDGDELIVADNRSTDGSAEAVRRLAPTATVIDMPANDGYMPAANAAAARATGDLIITLDADEPDPPPGTPCRCTPPRIVQIVARLQRQPDSSIPAGL